MDYPVRSEPPDLRVPSGSRDHQDQWEQRDQQVLREASEPLVCKVHPRDHPEPPEPLDR